MPELPEVETTVSSLRKKALKRAFVRVWDEKGEKELKNIIRRRVESVERFGKGIFLFLDNEKVLFIHLRMTGHLLFGNWEMKKNTITGKEEWKSKEKIMQERKNGFLRYVFFLDNGKQLALSDPRKFAKVALFSKKEAKVYIEKLGPDPLLLGKNEFIDLFKGRKKKIKTLLMDQQFVSGIGNIYAAEILFKAKINPAKNASLLTEKEIEKIYDFTQSILKKAIKLQGDSTSDYRHLDGKKGKYQNHHLVYQRKGKDCFDCGEIIKKTVLGGRGTYHCPRCQKDKE